MKPPLVRTMGRAWFLARGAYFLVLLREASSAFIAAYLVFFLILVHRLSEGPEPYHDYLRFLASPGMAAFHLVALAFALWHAITWFNLTPKAVAVFRGEERVHPALIACSSYALWLAVTAFIVWRVL